MKHFNRYLNIGIQAIEVMTDCCEGRTNSDNYILISNNELLFVEIYLGLGIK